MEQGMAAPEQSPASAEPRRLGALLLVAILVYPVLFAWLLLRRGYSPTLRQGAFLWMGYNLLPAIPMLLGAY